ncbi:hypothetical protein J7E62_08335 [Variovorax paradoxus]|nr:hypothetical protein [Variovorax paradoxus]
MNTMSGEHVQTGTGDRVSYELSLTHGGQSTTYTARVLLAGGIWHELEAGTATGPDQDARTAEARQAVLAQIDGLAFDALNRPLKRS